MKYVKAIRALIKLFVSFLYDFVHFVVHSSMFFIDTNNKKESRRMIKLHRHEKLLAFTGNKKYKRSHRNPFTASIRLFTPEKISEDIYLDIADEARWSPSACNRQPIKIYRVENIDEVMKLQRGLREPVYNLMAIVADVNYYNATGERYQMYVDGGIFLMNTLTAIRVYGFGACPIHWCVDYQKDRKIRKLIGIKKSERIIAFITFGRIHKDAKTCPSKRRSKKEILVL